MRQAYVGIQQFPGAAVDGHRGQARHVAEQGADLPVVGVGRPGPVSAVDLHQLEVEHRLHGQVAGDVRVVHGHVHPGGEQDQALGQDIARADKGLRQPQG